MTARSPEEGRIVRHFSLPDARGARAASWPLVAFGVALIVLTCSHPATVDAPPLPRSSSAGAAAREATPRPRRLVAVEPAEAAPLPAGAARSEQRNAPELRRFAQALQELDAGRRQRAVRVLWLGDSHTAADYWSGRVRSLLWARHAPGGPGYLRLGLASYRHDQAVVWRSGRFRIQPESPARRAPQDDGVFGLGGIRAAPIAEPVRLSIKVARGALQGSARFTVLFDLNDRGAWVANLGAHKVTVKKPTDGSSVAGSPIRRLELVGSAEDTLELATLRGRPRFYGVIVEGSVPGVVLDTLGIDGARLATTLAWSEPAFAAEVMARRPDLAIIAYGTNEAFDGLRVSAYEEQMALLVGRIRRGAPEVDCLIVGPPDALDPTGASAARVALIGAAQQRAAAELGCAFVSAQALMGGPGSYADWMRTAPPLATGDRVHYTAKGYRRLGELLAGAAFGLAPPVRETNSP